MDRYSDDQLKETWDSSVQKELDKPMPWIGMYIAGASFVCSLAMAADLFHGFQRKRFWFPCKYFSLNATSLALLAVAMKLPVDLNTPMWGTKDLLAKASSLVLMSTSMGNFMTSLGSMDEKDVIMNLTALTILVITVIVNVWIQLISNRIYSANGVEGFDRLIEYPIATVFMGWVLATLFSSALTVSTNKRFLELKYQEMHRKASAKELGEKGQLNVNKLRVVVKRYWVMVETGSPQFVMARLSICILSGAMCLAIALVLLVAEIQVPVLYKRYSTSQIPSVYEWSTLWILASQSIGVAAGTLAPTLRSLNAIYFKWKEGSKSFTNILKIETFWTQMLMQWRDSPSSLHVRHHRCRKLLHTTKRLILNFCIHIQIAIVLASKFFLLVSILFTNLVVSPFGLVKGSIEQIVSTSDNADIESGLPSSPEPDFSSYIVLLEGEAKLPKKTLMTICNQVDRFIESGKVKQPKKFIELLRKSMSFDGVRNFNSDQVTRLYSQQLNLSCWSLAIVTLSSIAISIQPNNANWLLSSVSEGLFFVKLIEKSFDENGDLVNIRNAADAVWVGVELYHKWLDKDLLEAACKDRTPKQIIEELSNIAEIRVLRFKNKVKDFIFENPKNWPFKIVSANMMYEISRTILSSYPDRCEAQTAEELFKGLTVMIADIMAACLSNLGRVITMMCHQGTVKEREKNVQEAAFLLGKTEEVLEILQRRELPRLDSNRAAYIEEWRSSLIRGQNENQRHQIPGKVAPLSQCGGSPSI